MLNELKPVGDGDDGAAAFAGDLDDGHLIHAIKPEDGENGRVLPATGAVKPIQDLKNAAGDLVGLWIERVPDGWVVVGWG